MKYTSLSILSYGYSVAQLLLQFHDILDSMDTITDTQKSVIYCCNLGNILVKKLCLTKFVVKYFSDSDKLFSC